MSAFDRLLEQIDAFIRKFYRNEMIRGLILFAGIFLVSYILFTTLEYFGRFNSTVRAVFFFSFVVLNSWILIRYLLIPLSKLYSFGKRISRYQASQIIGRFFPEISDRLLNTLQLNDSLGAQTGNYELIRASVAQRAETLSVVPFTGAVDVSRNRTYLRWLIPVILLFGALWAFSPTLFMQGTDRVLNFNREFVPEAPFKFELVNTDLSVEQGENVNVEYKLSGNSFPDKVYIVSDQGRFLMDRTTKNSGTWLLKNVARKTAFHFEGGGFRSREFAIVPVPKTSIGKLEAKLVYPAYLGRSNETVQNVGDLTVPEGTRIEWSVLTKNAKQVDWYYNDSVQHFRTDGFIVNRRIFEPASVRLTLHNANSGKVDTSGFYIHMIRDAYPTIRVEEVQDTLKDGVRFFGGSVADDYGLGGLKFVYTITSKDGTKREKEMRVVGTAGTTQDFDFAVDFRREDVKLDDRIEYFFVVWDNDGVHGPKSTKSQTFVYKLPSLEELNEKRDEAQNAVRDGLSEVMQRTEEFQENVNRLRKESLNSKSSDWNKLNQVQQLKQEQQSLQKQLEAIKQKMEQSAQEKEQLSEMDQQLLEKQEMIEKLLDEVMDDELRDLLDKLEELMKKNNQRAFQEQMEELEMSAEDMNKQLDRSLEMLKKLQVNEKIDAFEEELKKLSEEQLDLKEQEENKEISDENAKQKQDEMNERFDQLKEDLKELKELNEELQRPLELGDQEQMEQQISEDMKEAGESLQKGKSGKAGPKQQSASEQMQQMADELNAMQQKSNEEQQGEDIEMLRQILKNLMTLSFDQEMIMNRFMNVAETDPAYTKYGRKQRAIIDDTKLVADSLEKLAKRQPKIASFIDRELNNIASNHKTALEDIDEHRKRELGAHQQSAMTSYNNLALLLNESLENMQQQMKSMKPGSGSCNKPGGSGQPKPGNGMSSGDMKQMLKQQLENMQKGSNPGGKKPGESPGQGQNGQGGMGLGNKQIAKMAAEQSAIRRRLEQLRDELNKEGQGKGNQLNPLIKELEEQEKDLINKNFTPEMIERQKEIMTRLLESEKAIEERGYEDKRESEEGKNQDNGNQIRFDEYNKQKLKQIELLRSVDPTYQKYYRDKANEYFNQAN